jgi:hypothetical protein
MAVQIEAEELARLLARLLAENKKPSYEYHRLKNREEWLEEYLKSQNPTLHPPLEQKVKWILRDFS